MKLLLFDIDGTLIRSNGAGRAAMVATLEDVFGTAGPIDDYPMNGKTDPRIITDLLTAVGIPSTHVQEKLPAVYQLMAHKAAVIFPTKKMTTCPGVTELLTALQKEEGMLLGLLTGNAAITAPLKLLYAGLDAGIFATGAYGSDHFDRNQLPAIAMHRAT
ncbi:MAG: HAD family hydrolase, partial [Anaerolineales bacterium]|nr:HAD family hydrolase [Anaerolineales bacterium]